MSGWGNPARASRWPWLVTAAAVLAAAALGVVTLRPAPHAARLMRSAVLPPIGATFEESLALSPNGRCLVFVAFEKSGDRALFARDLDSSTPRRVAGTEGAEMPFWSPDGASLGFFAGGQLKRVDVGGAAVRVLADAPTPRGGAWSTDGRIVFASEFRDGLRIVSAAGGTPAELTELDASRKEKSHRWPSFLPGGERLLFLAQTTESGGPNDTSTIEVLTLGSGERKVLVQANSSVRYAAGQLLFWTQNTLVAQPFDLRRAEVAGEARPIAEHVAYTKNGQAAFSVSDEGTLAYIEGADIGRSTLQWVDRGGRQLEAIAGPETFDSGFALSPDGGRLAAAVTLQGAGNSDIWIYDLRTGTSSRLTFEASNEQQPAWSPDGRDVADVAPRKNDGEIFVRSASGMGAERLLASDEAGVSLYDWPREGNWLLVGNVGGTTSFFDVQRHDLGTGSRTALVATPAAETNGAVAPDGAWLAYDGNETGRSEIYVRALGEHDGRWQISRDGGTCPRWRADGRELYYVSSPDWLVAVEIRATPGAFQAGTPTPLFRAPFLAQGECRPYDVAPDGQRFVVNVLPRDRAAAPITLLTNWTELLRKD